MSAKLIVNGSDINKAFGSMHQCKRYGRNKKKPVSKDWTVKTIMEHE